MTRAKHKPPPAPPKPLGPTREAMRHGDYILPETRGALAVYTNAGSTMLGKLHRLGSITGRQLAAGLCFTATYHAVWGSPSRRDSTQPVIGGRAHETEVAAAHWASSNARLQTILNRVKPAAYSLLVSVAVFDYRINGRADRPPGEERHKALKAALDECAEVYGVNE